MSRSPLQLEVLSEEGSLRGSMSSPAPSTPPSARAPTFHDCFDSPALSALDSGSGSSSYASPDSPEVSPPPSAEGPILQLAP